MNDGDDACRGGGRLHKFLNLLTTPAAPDNNNNNKAREGLSRRRKRGSASLSSSLAPACELVLQLGQHHRAVGDDITNSNDDTAVECLYETCRTLFEQTEAYASLYHKHVVLSSSSSKKDNDRDNDTPTTTTTISPIISPLSGLTALYTGGDHGRTSSGTSGGQAAAKVDAETIWGQVEIQNEALHGLLKKSIRTLRKNQKKKEDNNNDQAAEAIRLLGNLDSSSDDEADDDDGGTKSDDGEDDDDDDDDDANDDNDEADNVVRKRMRERMERVDADFDDDNDDGDQEDANDDDDDAFDNDDDIPAVNEMKDGFFNLREMEAFADEEEAYYLPQDDDDQDDDNDDGDEEEEEDAPVKKRARRRKAYRGDDEIRALEAMYDDPSPSAAPAAPLSFGKRNSSRDDDDDDDGYRDNDDDDDDVIHMTAADFFGEPNQKYYQRYKKQQQRQQQQKKGKKNGNDDDDDDSWDDDMEDLYQQKRERPDSGDDDEQQDDNGEEGEGEDGDGDKQQEDDEEVVAMKGSNESASNNGKNKKNMNKQRQSKQQQIQSKLDEQTLQLEKELLAEKPWQMTGEATGSARPTDSLVFDQAVATGVEFEMNTRKAPVITVQHTANLEDRIKQRIAAQDWDDVVPRKLPDIGHHNRNNQGDLPEVSQERSKLGLGELYEREYLKKAAGYDVDKVERDELRGKAKDEMRALFCNLCSALDALSNYHYTPRPVQPEADVKPVATQPALAMEEVLPLHVSKARSAAPADVYAGGEQRRGGVLRGDSELDGADRKRKRSARKRARRKKRRQDRADERLAAKASAGLDNPYERRKMRDELRAARARGQVVVEVAGGGGASGAGAGADKKKLGGATFFQQLQEQQQQAVSSRLREMAATDGRKKKKKAPPSSALKL